MRFSGILSILASQAIVVSATDILAPLYVYPAATWNDGATNWKPAFDAINSTPEIEWLPVVNPQNGPGLTSQPGNNDVNYINGTAKLNSYPNVRTIGYVHTNYGTADMTQLKNNITVWANWKSYKPADLSIKGIFFDESSSSNYTYLYEAVRFARSKFGNDCPIVCNFGVKVNATYYNLCDVVIAFESCLNCKDSAGRQLPQWKGKATIDDVFANTPIERGAVIVNQFKGSSWDGKQATAALLKSYLKTIVDNGVGWAWFTSGDYNTITTQPATVGNVAKYIDEA